MNKYLDDNGLLYLWGKIKTLVTNSQIQSDWNQSNSSAGDYIKNKPSLGTASAKDAPASGNASGSQVVLGDDTRLTDSRNAADVYSWAKQQNKPQYTPSEIGAIPSTEKGSVNGVATLDSTGKVPSSQLPSYVDDVIETYGITGTTALTSGWLSSTSGGSALTPEAGKIYVLMADFPSTDPVYYANSQFRWSGTSYVQIYDSGVTSITNGEIDTITTS